MTGRTIASTMVSFRGEQDIPQSNVRSLTGTSIRRRLWQGAFLGLNLGTIYCDWFEACVGRDRQITYV